MSLEVKNVKFGYRSQINNNSGKKNKTKSKERCLDDYVLKDMTFTCRDNCVTGIIGPNGCGKTTTLKVITGFYKAESGSVLYDGKTTDGMSNVELAKLRAVVEQSVYSPFSLPVYDYVMLGRTPYQRNFSADTEEEHDIVIESLKSMNALKFQDRKITELSGGELQRIMIARALAQKPKYLMLDEPTSHLDIHHQLEVMKLLKGISKNTTVLCIIHEINQASAYCDDVVLTKGGYVIGEGAAKDVLTYKSLKEVFDVIALETYVPEDNKSQFLFSLPSNCVDSHANKRIHVISGEGRGRRILISLKSAGYNVSAGILGISDSDNEICLAADIPTVTAHAFSECSDSEILKLKKYCDEADILVFVAVNVGPANLPNLEIAYDYLKNMDSSKEFYFINQNPTEKKCDHTNGRATAIYNAMLKEGKVLNSVDELFSEINE